MPETKAATLTQTAECDACRRRQELTVVTQGPLELQLCDRCAGDPFYADSGLLRSFDHLQAAIQECALSSYVVGAGAEQRIRPEALAAVWELAQGHYPRCALGIGATRLTMAFGPRLVAKLNWHGLPKPGWAIETNLLQAASWLGVRAEIRSYLCPCLVLSRGGVLWMTRADPIAPAWDPTHGPIQRSVDAQATRDACRQWWPDLQTIRAALSREPVTFAKSRPNNYGLLDGRVVSIDALAGSPPGDDDFEQRMRSHADRLNRRGGDVSLEPMDYQEESAR